MRKRINARLPTMMIGYTPWLERQRLSKAAQRPRLPEGQPVNVLNWLPHALALEEAHVPPAFSQLLATGEQEFGGWFLLGKRSAIAKYGEESICIPGPSSERKQRLFRLQAFAHSAANDSVK